jgi:peptidoglycan/xylan/chitin deacetylase (PgdA/CDA1 family)
MTSLHPITLAAGLASPAGGRAKLLITIFHRVLERPDPLLPDVPDVERFTWQIKFLADHFNVLSLHEAARRLQEGTLPARAAAITFDDGYADNVTTALPILQRFGLPVTVFVATDYLDGGRMFNDTVIELVRRLPGDMADFASIGLGTQPCATLTERRALVTKLIGHFKYQPSDARRQIVEDMATHFSMALPTDLMLSTAQLRALCSATGVEIGAHTHTHPILSKISPEQAAEEIRVGKNTLESLLQRPMRLFAYPNGRPTKDYGPEHVELVRRAGFDFSVSTEPATAKRSSDPHQLPRFTPWDITPARFALRTLRMLYSTG